jgi:O-methyltransferase
MLQTPQILVSKIQKLPEKLKTWRDERERMAVYDTFKSYTMIPPWFYCTNLLIAAAVQSVPGCIVECGVWRGGMSAGLVSVLGKQRNYYLLDSFEGLPPAEEIDGKAAIAWQQDTKSPNYYDNCSADPSFAQEAMEKTGAPFHLIKGFFNATLPTFECESIALLRLDGDWYESTMDCLTHLFDRVAPGGIIILDDYYTWDGCTRALHDFLSLRKATERIECINRVCFLRRLS